MEEVRILDVSRYQTLAQDIIANRLGNFGQYMIAGVTCQKLTEGLEGLYFALAFYFFIYNLLTVSRSRSKGGDKRLVLFEQIWPVVKRIVNSVLKSYAVLDCRECGPRSSITQRLCLDRIIVLWRILYL